MSDVYLRQARSTDAGKVGGILSEFIDTTPWMPRVHTRAEDIGFAGHMIAQGWVTVAEDVGHVTGFAACEHEDVHALYVVARARSAGVGSTLLQSLQARTKCLSLWTFQVNTRAQAFYKRHGFAEVERTDGAGNDEKLPDIRMQWTRGAT